MGLVAHRLARNGLVVIVAAMSPFKAVRDEIRRNHKEEAHFIEVFVDCPVSELRIRDTKGLYSQPRLAELSGISTPYEPPVCPEVYVNTHLADVDSCVDHIVGVLKRRHLLAIA